ncbi:hypothetical protein cand_005420 [Cryptosporidium andersoni]|uniref:V-SNARE coiled-coil homology domain-containing protein n=1 Tax=Cryptosporidium andersoni TaxID=117008 RepID=A0A1J4MJK4_9CRYT|nr:hypothetical protein cand_005420 [Cryptosporidium andersoni]
MAEQYIYDPEYVAAVQEQVYQTLDKSRSNLQQLAERQMNLESIGYKSGQFVNTTENFTSYSSRLERKMFLRKIYNGLVAMSVIFFVMMIIYLVNKMLFWLIIFSAIGIFTYITYRQQEIVAAYNIRNDKISYSHDLYSRDGDYYTHTLDNISSP